MACLARTYAADGSSTCCGRPEHTAGLGLCALHEPFGGEQPRLPPAVGPGGRLWEEIAFFEKRVRTVGATTKVVERHRCCAVTQQGRCKNVCALLPYCPTHLLLELSLLVDLQRIGDEFQLGLYAFNAAVGRVPAVFVPGAEVVSAVHLSSFGNRRSMPVVRAGERAYYAKLCGEPITEVELRRRYGDLTAPNSFALGDGRLLDCTWRPGAITMANTQPGAGGNNAVIVAHELAEGLSAVSLEATSPIGQGRAVFVEYSSERKGDNAYDFDLLPREKCDPPLPSVSGIGSLYNFGGQRRPPPAATRGAGGALAIQQTSVHDLDGMLSFFDDGLHRRLAYCVKATQCQPWLRLALETVCDAKVLGIGMTVDAALARRGSELIETLRQYLATYGSPKDGGPAPADLLLIVLIFTVAMPPTALAPAEAALVVREWVEGTLAPLFADSGKAWTEGDSIAARAYVAALAQVRPWQRPLKVDGFDGLPDFDQMNTGRGWRINLAAALFCPAAACAVPEWLADWRTQFLAEPPPAPIAPAHLRRMHVAAFAKVREAVAAGFHGLADQALSRAECPVVRTAFDAKFSVEESRAAVGLGRYLSRFLG